MIDPEHNRPRISDERQAYMQELNLAKLGIRDWADAILSDPDLCASIPDESSIQQYATWLTGGGRLGCELWRIDTHDSSGAAPATRYHLAVHDAEDRSSKYYQLDPDQSTPKACSANWDKLAAQSPYMAKREMLTYLRTSPVDATTMLTRKEVGRRFNGIVRRYGRSDKQTLRRIAERGVGGSALDTLRQMLNRDNDA